MEREEARQKSKIPLCHYNGQTSRTTLWNFPRVEGRTLNCSSSWQWIGAVVKKRVLWQLKLDLWNGVHLQLSGCYLNKLVSTAFQFEFKTRSLKSIIFIVCHPIYVTQLNKIARNYSPKYLGAFYIDFKMKQ